MRTTNGVRMGVLLCAIGGISAGSVEAARLTPVSVEDVRLVNGEPSQVPGSHRVVDKAAGSGFILHHYTFTADAPAEPVEETSDFQSQVQYLILPEGDEVERQCVVVDWSYEVTSALTATGSADARLGVGGGNATVASDPPSVVIDGPSDIIRQPPASPPMTQFSFGPAVRGPADPDFAVQDVGEFGARIGDQVQLRLTTGTGWSVPAGDSLSGNLAATIEAQVRDGVVACSVLEIPTLGETALVLLVLLLAVAGAVALRL